MFEVVVDGWGIECFLMIELLDDRFLGGFGSSGRECYAWFGNGLNGEEFVELFYGGMIWISVKECFEDKSIFFVNGESIG